MILILVTYFHTFGKLIHNIRVMLSECTLYPFIVIFFGLIIVCCFICGIFYLNITTDPVELWSSKDSRCREEMNYFNENFGPFYRVQQVIVSSKASDKVYFVFFMNFFYGLQYDTLKLKFYRIIIKIIRRLSITQVMEFWNLVRYLIKNS